MKVDSCTDTENIFHLQILQTLADSQIKMSSLQKRVIQRRNFLTSWQETQPVDNNG